MNKMTQIYRQNIIDNVYPSDLCKDDIKKGLQIKEDMINSITDEYINEILPNWENILTSIEDYGISIDDYEKFANGEITLNDITYPENVKAELYICPALKETDIESGTESDIESDTESDIESKMIIGDNELIKDDWNLVNGDIMFNNPTSWEITFKLVLTGHNSKNYNLLPDEASMVSGWIQKASELTNDFEFIDVCVYESTKIYFSNTISFSNNNIGSYLMMQWIGCDYPASSKDVVSCVLVNEG